MTDSMDCDAHTIHTARSVYARAGDYRMARAVQVAVKVGVFAELARQALSTVDLAKALDLNAVELEKVLIALGAADLLQRDGQTWTLTEPARIALDPASPVYQGNIIIHMSHVWDTWHQLESRLRDTTGDRTGPPPREAQWHRHFILGMHNLAMSGNAVHLAEHVDLADCHGLLDVGGGPGTYAMALCRRYPSLQATLFDLPETLDIARSIVDRLGYTERINFVAGDWNQPDYGGPFDALLMSNILHGPTSQTPAKLAKAHRALRPGGTIIVQDFLLDPEKSGPILPALFNIMVGAWAVDELTGHLAAAGFRDIGATPGRPDSGQTILTARRS